MTLPPGSWPSPITAEQAVSTGRSLEAVDFVGPEVWWSEGRPAEGGRIVVCRNRSGLVEDLLPAPWNARTRVHEYGGRSWLAIPGAGGGHDLVFSHFDDQRLYRLTAGSEPRPLTPAPAMPAALRYADVWWDERRQRLIAVRESHRGDGTHGTVDRTLVAVPVDGSAVADPAAVTDLLAGQAPVDFLAGPRLSAAGDALVWFSWNHPAMPWDETAVWWARMDRDGRPGPARRIAGGPGVAAVDPGFSSDGSVLVMSDESGWWQPIVIDPATGARRSLTTRAAEFAPPWWVTGHRTWAPLPGGRMLVRPDAVPAVLDTFTGELTPIDPEWTAVSDLATTPTGRMALIVGGDTADGRVVRVEPDGARSALRWEGDTEVPAGFLPRPRARAVDGIHVIVYPPTHADFRAAPGTAPLLVTVHGGPTAQHPRNLSLRTAYFTSRGFAVVAVDYRGSTGYGRAYRDALQGRWAELDISDVITATAALLADGTAGRAVISGGSAGGLTVLGALTTLDQPFSGGTSSYGVGDLIALGDDTHDFESRYLAGLLGPDREVWRERSPLTRADRLAVPVLLLQGGRDPVVTPRQAEAFAAACRRNHLPHALVVFPEESHGFRAAAARIAALEAEMSFYGQVLGFPTPGVPALPLSF